MKTESKNKSGNRSGNKSANKSLAVKKSFAKEILLHAKKYNLKIACAESCTGGLLSDSFVSVPGASKSFLGSFVLYDSNLKVKELGIKKETIKKFSAESSQVSKEMLFSLADKTKADICFAITGHAGPISNDKREDIKIKKDIYFGFYVNKKYVFCAKSFSGERNMIRKKAVLFSLKMMYDLIRYSYFKKTGVKKAVVKKTVVKKIKIS